MNKYTYDFDTPIDRSHTNALKVDGLQPLFGRSDLIPMWVADMDFLCPPGVVETVNKRAQHGIYGYTSPSQSYYDSIMQWVDSQHNWKLQQDWISFIPGIVRGIAFAVDCFTGNGDNIVIQPPVYHPFRLVPEMLHRRLVYNPLVLDGNRNRYDMDLQGLKAIVQNKDCRMLILCNPHNPGGRVWSRDELIEIAEICYDNHILVISDEIHADLTLNGHRHVSFASVSEKAAQNSITFMAPSKTFNIAGFASSFALVPNQELRQKYFDYLTARQVNEGHIFAYIAAEAAYTTGRQWRTEVLQYLWENVCFVDDFLKTNLPQIKAMIPEASFLIWLDCRQLRLSQSDLVSFFINEAKLALNDGTMFGVGGEGYMRINIGTSRTVLEKALNQLKLAVEKRKL